MLALLPIIALIILVVIFHKQRNCYRSSILLAAITWGIGLVAITEILSIVRLLTFSGLVGIWGVVDITLIFIYLRFFKQKKQIADQETRSRIPSFTIPLLSSIGFIVAAVGLIAIVAPPNNWDVLSYHMPRVAHWIQTQSVAHYPTSYLPQLYQKPWSEFAVIHLQILSGGDHLANLVQWFSMVGSILGVSLIAKEMGADLRGQIFSAVVCATIPTGILQASTPKNDYVLAFWLVCFTYYVLVTLQNGINWSHSFKLGTSLGLACLTKATAYLYAFPVFIWLLIAVLKRFQWQKLKYILGLLFIVVLLNIGHEIRNIDLFGVPFASGKEKYTNDVFGLSVFLSNIIRNISLHLVLPNSIAKMVETGIKVFHENVLGIDVNDPRTTWLGKFQILNISLNEDTTNNFIHLLLIFFSIALCFTRKKIRIKNPYIVSYLIVIVSAFMLFCLLLKWQPFHSRLHLPLFVLFSAFIGVILSNFSYRKLTNLIIVTLIISSLPWVFCGQYRPLFLQVRSARDIRIENVFNTSRINQYFVKRPELIQSYIGATNILKSQGCSQVGLFLNEGGFDYPFWMLMQRNSTQKVRLEYVNVKNISLKKYQEDLYYKNFVPCGIISISDNSYQTATNEGITNNISFNRNVYSREWTLEPVSVFMKKKV